MTTTYTFRLMFNSNTGEKIYLTIPRASSTLTETDARANMQALIDNGGVITEKGYPIEIMGAARTKREVEELVFA